MWAGLTEQAPAFAEERARVASEMEAIDVPFDPAAWTVAQRALRVRRMLAQE